MRTFKCDVCGQDQAEKEIGRLSLELQEIALPTPDDDGVIVDVCRICNQAIGDAMHAIEEKARKEFVEPLLEAAQREEEELHKELVIPAGKAAIETIRRGNAQPTTDK